MTDDLALTRLRDPKSDYLQRLARMVVDDATSTPMRDVAAPGWIASQLAATLEAATRTDAVRDFVARRLDEGRERWADEQRTVRTWMVPEVEDPLRTLLSRPWSPSEELTMRVIDQGVFHELLKEVLENSLRRFNNRLRSFDQDKLGGLGKRAKAVGRGLFGNIADNFGGAAETLRGSAQNIVGTVQNELEGVVERRIDEFLGSATGEAMKIVARHVTDPDNADAYSEMRLQILDVLLDTTVAEFMGELDKLHPLEGVDVVVSAMRSMVRDPSFVERTEARIATLLDQAGDGTLGAWLDEVQLRQVWTDTTTELITARLQGVVQTPEFESWWRELHA